jgi:hypothetical protein
MSQGLIPSSLHVDGQLSCKTFRPPAGSINNDAVTGPIGATKLEHQLYLHLDQVPGTAVVAQTKLLHTVYGATAEVVAIKAMTPTPATGADRQVSIDLQKGNAGSGFATILTGNIVLDNTNAPRTPESGTVANPDLVAGDSLQAVITVAGSAGAQAQGLLVTITLRQDAQ